MNKEIENKSKHNKFILRKIEYLTLDQQLKIRELRNQIGVRSSMYNEHEIGINEHLEWISRIKSDRNQIIFAVLKNGNNPIGVVSVSSLDTLHKKADWAFYLDENERGGLGSALEYSLIEYVFNVLGIEKLNCEVIENNEAVFKLHKKFSFIEEGFRRENIEKNNERIGVYLLGLTKREWKLNKEYVYEKFRSRIENFPIIIEN